MKKIFMLAMMLFLFNFSFSFELSRVYTAKNIVDREPVGVSDVFTVGEKIYLFNEFKEIGEKTDIKHQWFLQKQDGSLEKKFEIQLPVKGERWRTWSYKTASHPGTWVLRIVCESEELIFEKNVEVTE